MSDPPGPGRRPRFGLVIGSGGLKCAAALGLWKVLDREGIPIDMTVGCSGGSLYASLVALGWRADVAERLNAELWTGAFPRYRPRSLLSIALPRLFGLSEEFGFLDDRRLNGILEDVFGETEFSGAKVPLFIVATDMRSGEKVVLTRGRLRDAIRASIAIPFALRPWRVDGRLLFDGGACDPLPTDVAVREGCDIIVAMGFESSYEDSVSTAAGLVLRTSAITVNHFLKASFAFQSLAHHAEILPVMPSFPRRAGLKDVHLIPELIAAGEEAAEEQLPYLRRLLAEDDATGKIRL